MMKKIFYAFMLVSGLSGCGTQKEALQAAADISVNINTLNGQIEKFSSANANLTAERIRTLSNLDNVTIATQSFVDTDKSMLKLRDKNKYDELQWVLDNTNLTSAAAINQPVISNSADKDRSTKLRQTSEILSQMAKEQTLKEKSKFYFEFVKTTSDDFNKMKKDAEDKLKGASAATTAKVSTEVAATHGISTGTK